MNKILITFLLFFIGYHSYAQPVIKNIPCDNSSILQQADSLKKAFEKDNFTLLKEASMSMESEYEIPVIVPLKGGAWSVSYTHLTLPTKRIV